MVDDARMLVFLSEKRLKALEKRRKKDVPVCDQQPLMWEILEERDILYIRRSQLQKTVKVMKQFLNIILLVACLWAVIPAIILTVDHLMDPSDSVINKIIEKIKG